MNNTMTYKGYTGSVEFSREDGILWGRVLGLQQHIIDYEGESISELEKDFHAGIDHYLKICKEEGIKPNESPEQKTPRQRGKKQKTRLETTGAR